MEKIVLSIPKSLQMNVRTSIPLIIILIVAIFPLFSHLDTLPMQRWDEARLSVKAYEMFHNGNWIVPHYAGSPGMWSTKPPLMIWSQVLSFKIFGISTLAARIPSAVAALFTVVLICWFYISIRKNYTAGIIACLILITTGGLSYVSMHGTRTGDYDSLLALCTTAYLIFFYTYLVQGSAKYILLTWVFVALAGLTKGVQGMIFLPVMLLMVIVHKRLGNMLKRRQFYIGLLLFIILVPGYYLLREQYNPGYIKAVYNNELGGRAFNTLEGHYGGPLHYIKHLWRNGIFWFAFVPIAVLFFFSTHAEKKHFLRYLFCVVVFYIIIISAVKTKLYWYLIPIYPLMAMIVAEMLETLFTKAANASSRNYFSRKTVMVILVTAAFIYPYKLVLQQVAHEKPEMHSGSYMTAYLYSIEKGERDGIPNLNLMYSDLEQDVYWYYVSLKDKYGLGLKSVKELKAGDHVASFNPNVIATIERNYQYTILEQYYNIKFYNIEGKKT